jgi:O-antigen/teichoic acid export membrane protein
MSTAFKGKVVSGLLWSAIRIGGNRLGGLLIFFVLARHLTTVDFGIYAAVWAILFFVEIFSELGLSDAIVQRTNVEPELLNSVFAVNLIGAVAIYATIWVLAPLIGGWMHMPDIELPLRIASLTLVFNALGFSQLAMCRREFAYRWLAMRTLVATLVSGALGIGMAFAGFGVWALIAQLLTMALVNMVMLWLKPMWRPSLQFSMEGLRQVLHYSLKLMLSRVLDATSTRAFEVLIGAWMGAATLGVYSVGSRINSIVMQLLSSAGLDVAHSSFSRLAGNKDDFLSAYYKAITATAAIALPAFVLMASVGVEICETFFGARWAASGSVLSLLALLGGIQVVEYVNGTSLSSLGRSDLTLLLSLTKALVTVLVLFVFGHGELHALLMAFVIGQGLVCPLSFALSKRFILFRWRQLGQSIVPFVVAAAAAYLAIAALRQWWLPDSAWLRLFAFLAAGGITYAVGVLVLAPKPVMNAARVLARKVGVLRAA